MLQVNEFRETYPNWNKSFMAHNPMTATEKLFGMRMSGLLYYRNRQYQQFPISQNIYDMLISEFNDGRSHCFDGLNFNVVIVIRGKSIVGWCKETKERVSFAVPCNIATPGEHGFSDEYDSDYSQYRREMQERLYE